MDGLSGAGSALICCVWRSPAKCRAFHLYSCSGNGDAGVIQHAGQADQGEADQAGAVLSLGGAEEADAEPFGLEAASAVIRLFCFEIAPDLFFAE